MQRQLRGNLPQAFVHALLLESAHRLGEAGVNSPASTRDPQPDSAPLLGDHMTSRRVPASSSSPERPAASAAPPPACSPSGATTSPCWPAASTGLEAAAHEVEAARRRRAADRRSTPPTTRRSSVAADRVEERARRDRRLGQRRLHLGVRPLRRHRARGVPPRHRGDLPRLRQRHPGRAAPDAAARPRRRSSRSGRRSAYRGIPLQSAYCGAKHAIQGFHESLRTELLHDQQQRPRHHRADAGREHPAVHLGAVQAPAPGPAGAADLPARGRRPRRRSTPPTTPTDGPTGSGRHRRHHPRQRGSRRGLLDRYLARTGFASQQTDEPRTRASRPTSGSRPTATRTSAPTGASTTGPPRAARSCGPPSTTGWSAR